MEGANVFFSAVAEVLAAFLFGNDYEKRLLEDKKNRWDLRDIMTRVNDCARAEIDMLIRIQGKDPSVPLFVLSE